MRWRRSERTKNLDVLWRVREVIFAADDMRDFHLEVIDHVYEMKNPRAIRAPNRHIGMRSGIGQIEIDLAADQIVDHDVFAWRTETQSSLVFEDVAGVLKFLQIALVKFRPLALQIWPELSTNVQTLVPIQAQPFQPLVNGRHGFLGVSLDVGVLDPQYELSAMMPRKEPVEERGSGAADVKIA